MVTVYGKRKEQAKRRIRRWLAVALSAALVAPAFAAADGMLLPDELLKPKKKAAPAKAAPAPAAPAKTAPAQSERAKPAPSKATAAPPPPPPVKIAPAKSAPAPAQPAAPTESAPAPALKPSGPTTAPPPPPPPKIPVVPSPVSQTPNTTAEAPAATTTAFMATPPRPAQTPPTRLEVSVPVTKSVSEEVHTVEKPEVHTVELPKLTPPTPIPRPALISDPDENDPNPEDAVDEDGDGAGVTCTGNCTGAGVKAGGIAVQASEIKKSAAAAANRGPGLAARLAQAAWYQAARCRDFADFKERRMGIAKYKRVKTQKGWVNVQQSVEYNSCKFFGKDNVFRSKGLCARATREAFGDAGIKIAKAHARDMRPNLMAAGFKKTAYKPDQVSAGTVLVCNGGSSGYGHMEVVVEMDKKRWFCSDFCSQRPTCTKAKGYSRAEAYSLTGS